MIFSGWKLDEIVLKEKTKMKNIMDTHKANYDDSLALLLPKPAHKFHPHNFRPFTTVPYVVPPFSASAKVPPSPTP